MATPEWIAIVDDEIIVRLNPTVLTQIKQDIDDSVANSDDEIIYKLNSQELLQVLASSVGIASLRQGAIVIWTYYSDQSEKSDNLESLPNFKESPIVRTLMNIDGDMNQKICQDILIHPLGDRLLKNHSYIVGQISRQFITAIAEYIELKLRPFAIATISMATVFSWCEPLRNLGEKMQLPEAVIGNCWRIIIAAPITVFIIWWINSKVPFKFSALPKFAPKFDPKLFQNLGKAILKFLESRILQTFAIAIIIILLLGWLINTFTYFPVDGQLSRIIHNIELYIKPYLPIALISMRRAIVNTLGKIFFRYSFFVKLIFGRFVR